MARPDKAAAVAELKEKFSNCAAAVLTDYRGLTVAEMKDLRQQLGADTSYAVAKNTLAAIAAKEAGIEGLDDQLAGPTAIAFINGDIAVASKTMRSFAKEQPLLIVKGAVLEGKVMDADMAKKLADLESREVLLAKLAGGMKASMSKAVATFAAPLSKAARLVGALETKAKEDPSVIGGAGEADQKPQAQEAKEESTAVAADSAASA